jgi:hypothetical protein
VFEYNEILEMRMSADFVDDSRRELVWHDYDRTTLLYYNCINSNNRNQRTRLSLSTDFLRLLTEHVHCSIIMLNVSVVDSAYLEMKQTTSIFIHIEQSIYVRERFISQITYER